MGGCSKSKNDWIPYYKGVDQTNKMWGKWRVLGFAQYDSNNYNHKWRCLCTGCGTQHHVVNSNLTLGKSRSCLDCCSLSGSSNGNWKGYKDISSSYFTQLRNGASIRDIDFKVTMVILQDALDKQKHLCALTGVLLSPSNRSLDRIDSSKPYIENNIQWVTKVINKIKLDLSMEEFIEACRAVTNYQSVTNRENS